MNLNLSPYLTFSRVEWAKLRNAVPMLLNEKEVEKLQGINEDLSMEEVSDIYLPLSRLISYSVMNHYRKQKSIAQFLGQKSKVPYVIGITGSVAVGKSTCARLLQRLLERWPEYRKVALITTDGFLYNNETLQQKNIMHKKGFPESYDQEALLSFIARVKAGEPQVTAPIYSHHSYDIVPDEFISIERPDVLIIEGLNILQVENTENTDQTLSHFLSDFIDFSIYVDAPKTLLNEWYLNRFIKLRESAFVDPNSYFHHYAEMDKEESIAIANHIWKTVNQVNLEQHILPTRNRADLILTKGVHHNVEQIKLRR